MACNTMVERMARAMCTEITGRNAYSELTTTKATLDRMALAVLRELRNPTHAMLDAMERTVPPGDPDDLYDFERSQIHAAIDAAIAEAAAAGRAPIKSEGK